MFKFRGKFFFVSQTIELKGLCSNFLLCVLCILYMCLKQRGKEIMYQKGVKVYNLTVAYVFVLRSGLSSTNPLRTHERTFEKTALRYITNKTHKFHTQSLVFSNGMG